MTLYRATVNFARCPRGEVRDFPNDARTAALVSSGILVPVGGAPRVAALPLDEVPPEWFTQSPPLLKPPAPVEPPPSKPARKPAKRSAGDAVVRKT